MLDLIIAVGKFSDLTAVPVVKVSYDFNHLCGIDVGSKFSASGI